MFLLAPLLSASLESNIVNAVRMLVRSLGVRASTAGIKEKLQEHPHYPSLASISDVLTNWKISNVSIRANRQKLEQLPAPFMVQMKENGNFYFVVVKSVDANGLLISDKYSRKWKTINWDEFLQSFTGIVTVTEAAANAGEPEYLQRRQKEWFGKGSYLAGIGIILVIVAATCIDAILTSGVAAWFGIAMILLKLPGVYTAAFLLWYEVDKNNVLVQKVCRSDKKINCNAILQSKASRLWGFVSWSEIGFAYFTGGLLFLMLSGLNKNSIALMAMCSLTTLPYVLFSLFYQSRIARQWCLLCLTVVGILIAEFITAFAGNIYSFDILNLIVLQQVFLLLACFALPLILWFAVKPALSAAGENKKSKLSLIRLKHNSQIFESQLVRQKKVLNDNSSLGVILGNPNPNAKTKIIKVCNPFCGPCAQAHPEIHRLIEDFPDLQVQIIFTASSSEKDHKAPPVQHFLAIRDEFDEKTLDEALTHWYASKEKNYDSFSLKYPVKSELQKYNGKLNEMVAWCKLNNISYTPTIFVNSFELPEMYDVSDIKFFLT